MFQKEMMRFQNFHIKRLNGYLAWMPVGVKMNHSGSSMHAQWFTHQNGGMDIHDII